MRNYAKKVQLFICFLISFNLCSQSKEPLSIDGKVLDKKEKNCSYKIKYPILKLGKDSKYDVSVVRNIGKVFIDEFTNIEKYENEFECNKKDKNASPFTLNGDFTVKLKTDSILSIHSSFSSYVEGNPYPNNVFKTYNFELNSGKEIAFEDLFKKDSKYLIPLHKFMAEAMLKEKVISEKDEFIALKKEKYDFYLTQNAIVFINLFDIHAMQSVEVMIPYDKMKKYLNTDMVLKFVK